MKVFRIISKSLKLLMRSKTSLITTFLGPILIIALVGLAFGGMNQSSITIGVISHGDSSLVNSFVEKLANQSYKIVDYGIYRDSCIADIRKGTTHTCLEFPDNFELGVEGKNEIKYYVDESKTNVLAIVNSVVLRSLRLRTSELASQQTADVLSKIDSVDSIIDDQLIKISDVLVIAGDVKSDIDVLDRTSTYLSDSVTTSAGSLSGVSTKVSELYLRTGKIKDSGISAIDEADADDYNFSKDYKEDIEDDFNRTSLLQDEIVSLLNSYDSSTGDLNSYTSTIEDQVYSVKKRIDDMISAMRDMETSFAVATGNFDDINTGDTSSIVAPIVTTYSPVVSEQAPLHYMFPTLLVMVIMLVSIMLAGSLVVMEKTSSAFFRNFVTPTADITFIGGTFFTNLLIVFGQSLLILLFASLVFGSSILSNFLTILVCVLIIGALFTLLGMMLGYIFNSQEMVTLGGISLGSLFILLSGILVPLEQMPTYMIKLIRFNPVLLGENILRQSMIFGTQLLSEEIMPDLFMLLTYILVVFLLVVVVQKIKKEIFLSGVNILKKKKTSLEDGDPDSKKGKEKPGSKLAFLDEFSGNDDVKKEVGVVGKFIKKIKDAVSKKEVVVYSGDESLSNGSLKNNSTNVLVKPEDAMDEELEPVSDEKEKTKSSSKKGKKSKRATSKKQKESDEDEEDSTDESEDDIEPIEPKIPPQKKAGGLFTRNSSDDEDLVHGRLEPHQFFVLSSGEIVKSYEELIEKLNVMAPETFNYHVADDKNDFYLWIKNVVKADKPAEKIRTVNDPKKMAKLLKRFL